MIKKSATVTSIDSRSNSRNKQKKKIRTFKLSQIGFFYGVGVFFVLLHYMCLKKTLLNIFTLSFIRSSACLFLYGILS